MIKYYIGYCSTVPETAAVCESSMQRWISAEHVHQLKLEELQDCYHRPWNPNQSTEFSFTRFLVPFLNNYRGWALFCDGDFLWVGDPSTLSAYCDERYAVMCVQHDLQPDSLTDIKMDGKKQLWYRRKNWSSLMLFNCAHPFTRSLTPELINTASASFLHELDWAHESVGTLPLEYNFLVGYYRDTDCNVKAYHYTDGVPLYDNYKDCDHSSLWIGEYERWQNERT